MRISWVHPEVAARARRELMRGRQSWEEAFAGNDDAMIPGEVPEGFEPRFWPALAEHLARAERVREVVAQNGIDVAERRFGSSPHAIEHSALWEARAALPERPGARVEMEAARGILACAIDERIAYGQFLSRLVELGTTLEPEGTVLAFEKFVAAARAFPANDPSWPERVRAAEDGLAALYVRVDRPDDAERLFGRRFGEDAGDTALAIGAARAFLEAGQVARAVRWLDLGAARADAAGRPALAERLAQKSASLRTRMS